MTAPFTPDSAAPEPSTPSNISITALARFEFEAGKANDGTKILMIEWEDSRAGSWHVFWEGKKAVLPADEQTSESTRRFYFLLPPDVTIPPIVTLEYHPSTPLDSTAKSTSENTETREGRNTIQLNPLPAIFPPELGVTGRSAGKKGVLHTIWAKKRLQVLEREIREECLSNAEGIALHMAVQEKEWIETHFGLGPNADNSNDNGAQGHGRNYPMGPTTPVSPGGSGKLGEKLRGLKLQTSEQGLSPREGSAARLLSPQSPDVAVSSFNSFHNNHNPNPPAVKAVAPPESIQAQQHENNSSSGFASMNSLAGPANTDSGEELFAKALSPRSPDLPRSPFSFAPETLNM